MYNPNKCIGTLSCDKYYYMITHENPMQPIASPSMSPKIDGYEFPAGK